jgi:glycosyltransferase involved in cell wall biosynthesis
MANLITMLDRTGIEWDLVTLRPPRHGPGPLQVHDPIVLDRPAPLPQVRTFRQLRWLRRALAGDRYDAVIAFGPTANGLVSLARRRRRAIVVLSERGDPYIDRRRWWNRLFMWTYRRADVLVVPTTLLADEMTSRRGHRPPVRVIGNSLAPQVPFVPRDRPRRPTIVSVGRLAPVKRLQDLIEAFSLLGDRADGWSVVLVGEGEERPRLEALVHELGLGGRVTLVGVHEAPWQLLGEADLFVLCSAHEGFGNVLIEAMASGCAVVSSDCRFGPRELVDDGVNGVLYPTGDVERLAAVLGDLLDHPDRRDALARAGMERARAFTLASIESAWLEVIATDRPG